LRSRERAGIGEGAASGAECIGGWMREECRKMRRNGAGRRARKKKPATAVPWAALRAGGMTKVKKRKEESERH